jgi:hypothetical protein
VLNRDDYERVIDIFLVELNHLCLNVVSDEDLRSMPRLAAELDNYLADLRDPDNSARQMLYLAFAFVDQYMGADRERVISAGYEAYKNDRSRRDGNSN